MQDMIKRVMASLEMLGRLEKCGVLNPLTAKLLWLAHNKDNPSHEIELIETVIAIAQAFSSPFPKPDSSVAGPIVIAKSENKQLIGMFPHECHVLIAGSTGTGKSTLLRLIFTQAISKGLKIWLFVRAKDMRMLLSCIRDLIVITFKGNDKINPLNPYQIPIQDYCNIFSDNFIQTFGLYDGTKNYILENLNNLYKKYTENGTYPSIHDLYYLIEEQKHPRTSRTVHYQESALNRLGGMIYGTLGSVFDCSSGYEKALFENSCIFEIDSLTIEQQRFVVNLLLTNLFYHRNYSNPNKWMFVGIDDANLIFDISLEKRPDQGLPIIHHLITTNMRKSKINIFACTQTPHQIGSSVPSNSFAQICFSLSSGKDIDFCMNSMGIKDPDQKAYCYKIKPRKAIVKFSSRYLEPFLATIPEVEL